MNALLNSMIESIQEIPPHILKPDEREYFCRLLTLMPIDSENIDQLRNTQVELMAGFSNLHHILARRLAYYRQELAPRRVAVEEEAAGRYKHKLTIEQRETLVAANTECKPWADSIAIVETLLNNIKHQFDTLAHRERMLFEKSVESRRMEERH